MDNQHSLTFAGFHHTGQAMSAAGFERRVDFALITLSTKCGMQVIIRVAFNNQNWMGKCTNIPPKDLRFEKCTTNTVDVGARIDELGNCNGGGCWEKTLCTEYFWVGSQGNFGERARGTVFFVFPDVDGSLVLWGKSKVKKVEGNKVYFEEFEPMSEEKWVKGLRAKEILGVNWGNGTYRYLDKPHHQYPDKTKEDFLAEKIEL